MAQNVKNPMVCLAIIVAVFACVISNTEAKLTNRPKAELKKELRELFNGSGALVDFVFYEAEDIENYNKKKGPPKKRTELRRKKKPAARGRDLEEKVLAKALRDYGRGENKDMISKWSLILDAYLYNEFTDKKAKRLIEKTTANLFKRIEKQLGKSDCTTAKPAKPTSAPTTTKTIDYYSPSSSSSSEVGYRTTPTWRPQDELREIEMILKNVEDNIKKDIADEKLWGREKRAISEETSEYVPVENFRYLPRGPVQTIDHKRMRRAAPYNYTGTSTCKDEGSEGTTSDTVMLCKTCYNTIDFGSSVVPQYANSIECDDSASRCLTGDGTCTQKVVYYTFQMLVDIDTESWITFEQPLNVTCECECVANSMTHNYMVGNSNPTTEVTVNDENVEN